MTIWSSQFKPSCNYWDLWTKTYLKHKNAKVRIVGTVKLFALQPIAETATRGAPYKKMFLEISQNSQGNTCTGDSFLIGLQLY